MSGPAVRIFCGVISSAELEDDVPSVVVLAADEVQRQTEFTLIFFMPDPIVIRHVVRGLPGEDVPTELAGEAEDPRGWNVRWTAVLEGDTIQGSYQQPFDRGTFFLQET